MCGISGLANLDRTVPLSGYYTAHLRLRHRGMDDEGFFVVRNASAQFCRGDETILELRNLQHIQEVQAANVVLGHRRLSIIDLSPGGHQPMSDKEGRYTVVYNGEIFNYVELRQELEGLAHHFETQSDTEVLLAAFSQWGTACFNRLNGMWALALYDAVERRLILSRDRFGIKPLYYALIDSTLYFSSEVKFLIPFLPDLQPNAARVAEYLVHNLVDHCAETMFEGIHQVLPAHYTILDRAALTHHAYWRPPSREISLTLTEASEELATLLSSAVAMRLRSDVPIGSLLSGGLDSTTIACIVQQLLRQQSAHNTFESFSAVFHEAAFSERRYIEDTAEQTGITVHWIYPDPENVLGTLPQLLYHQEFPFRSLAVYSQWEIMRHVHATPIVVLLDGQGSDEIFAGYSAHYYALAAEYLRRLRPGQAWQVTRSLSQAREVTLARGLAGALFQLIRPTLLGRLLRSRPVPYLTHSYRPVENRPRQPNVFRDALVRNLTFSALPEYLRYEDRNSMAFTLESRLPFLDYRLVEWAMSLPAEFKIRRHESKRVLREAARPLIPASVSARTDKMGFVSPQELWQRGALRPALNRVFSRDLSEVFPTLNGPIVAEMYREYQAGRRANWEWVWRIACLYWWHECWWG
jgi:asparagine synthase (glutamine-hydrolysing)